MSTPPPGESFPSGSYQLPQQNWVCGHHAEGRPCALGPGGSGQCLVDKICEPWHDGTAWHCTRSRAWGGRCDSGPVPDPECPDQKATCPHRPAMCQPERSLRNKRRLVSGITAAAALGCCLLMLGGSSGTPGSTRIDTTAIVSPGHLSAHHAMIESGCVACHSAASESPLSLLDCAFGVRGGSGGIADSQKCIACHHDFGTHPLQAHSVAPAVMAEITAAQSKNSDAGTRAAEHSLTRMISTHAATENGELACASCHHEHRGARFDLTRLTNAQCQSCHTSTFHSFSDGHAEFAPRDRSGIHFDHLTHMQLHFSAYKRLMPDGAPKTDCADCHTPDSTRDTMQLKSYDAMCASCHDSQISDYDMPSALRLHELAFVSVRGLEPESTDAVEDALPAFLELMLDGPARDALAQLRAGENDQQTTASARTTVAANVSTLLQELGSDGSKTVRAKLNAAANDDTAVAGIDQRTDILVDALKDSGFFDAVRFFEQQRLLANDAEIAVPGGWQTTDGGRTIVYRSHKHADPVVRALIDLLASKALAYPEPPADGPAGVFDRYFRELAAPEATGRCLKCHTVDRTENGLTVNWQTRHRPTSLRHFTKFSHRPHLTLLTNHHDDPNAVGTEGQGDRCESCHALNEDGFRLTNPAFALDDGMPESSYHHVSTLGVNSVRLGDCAKCHTQNLAGDDCLQCHNYHVDPVMKGHR